MSGPLAGGRARQNAQALLSFQALFLLDILAHSVWYAFFTGLFLMLLGLALSFRMADYTPANTPQGSKPTVTPRRS